MKYAIVVPSIPMYNVIPKKYMLNLDGKNGPDKIAMIKVTGSE